MSVKDILTDLVAINTIRDKENAKIMVYCRKFLEKYGFNTKLLLNPNTNKCVLIAESAPLPKLGFLGHTDTVDITAQWETDPFTLTEKDGMLYGLGACDMKGGIAAALQAVTEVNPEVLKRGVGIYLTYDEEVMFDGIYDMVNENVRFPEHVIVAEPTAMGPGTSSKGLMEIKVMLYGETTHSSSPIKGKNSNKNAVKFMSKMMEFEEELKKETIDSYDVPYTTMNLGIVKGGTTTVKVPDYTEVWLDFRVIDNGSQYDRIIAALEGALMEACGGDASMFDYEINLDIPSFNNPDSELAQMVREKTGIKTSALNGITEGSFFDGDRVIIGPGPITAHQKNEHVSLADLEKLVDIYKTAIEKFA